MSDVFREVDEDLRRQRLEELWKQYGSWVIGAAVAFVVVVAALLYWKDATQRRQAALSDKYAAAVDLVTRGQEDEGLAALAELADSARGGYKALALMKQAQTLHSKGNVDEAVAIYDQVSKGNVGGRIVSELAKVKAAWALADTVGYEEIQSRVGSLQGNGSVWSYPAQEILAYSALKNGQTETARSAYQLLAQDGVAPSGLRERAAIMLSVMGPAPVEASEIQAADEVTETPTGEAALDEVGDTSVTSETVSDETAVEEIQPATEDSTD